MHQDTRSIALDRKAFAGLWLTLFLIAYNIGVMPPIMPLIVRELNSSMGYIQGALVLFSLVTASFAPTSENLCQFYGRKRIFVGGIILYGLGLLIAATSADIAILVIGFSLITGLAATPLVSTPWAMIDIALGGKAEKQATLGFILASVLGGLTGAILGGFIASNLGWRWAFMPTLGIVLLLVLLSRFIPNVAPSRTEPIDWIGGLLSFLGLGSILMGISLAGVYGWWMPKRIFSIAGVVIPPFALSIVPTLISVGVICLGFFLFWQRQKAAQPNSGASLFRIGLLRKRTFVVGLLAAMLHTLITTGVQFNLYQFLPTLLPLNPFQVALTVLPYTLTMVIVLITLLRFLTLDDRIPPKYNVYLGLGLLIGGLWMLYHAIDWDMTSRSLILPLMTMGLGSGLFLAYIGSLTRSAATPAEKPESTGIYNPVQNLGSLLGRGILGTILMFFVSQEIVDGILAVLGKALSVRQRQEAIATLQRLIQTYSKAEVREALDRLPDAVQPSLQTIIQTAAIEGMRTTLLVSLIFGGICFGLAMFLPKYPLKSR